MPGREVGRVETCVEGWEEGLVVGAVVVGAVAGAPSAANAMTKVARETIRWRCRNDLLTHPIMRAEWECLAIEFSSRPATENRRQRQAGSEVTLDMVQSILRSIFVTFFAMAALADDGNGLARVARHEPEMSYLDNGVIRLGIDLKLGGAITYLSKSDSQENVVNSWDFGRQIQMSYYSGPVPFRVPGKEPKKEWRFIGWNPIQVGDAFGNSAKVLEHHNDGKKLYVKCIPMHWPLDNVPGECTFECWLELDQAAVHARSRIVNNRPDHTKYPARGQELPAIYTNGPFYRLMTYTGDKPFTGDALSRIEKRKDEPGPWSSWIATESWSALVNDDSFGLGVWFPGGCGFAGGFAGNPGKGGPHDDPTGYLSPQSVEILDWNIAHEYRYDLMLGNLEEMRKYVYAHATKPAPPAYRFNKDRQGWSYVHAVDTGWPIRGELNVLMEENDPKLIGPVGFWRAEDGGTVVVEAACHSGRNDSRLYWRRLSDAGFDDTRSESLALTSDGDFHTYRIKLSDHPNWKGPMTQLRFDPVGEGAKGDWIRIKSIEFEK